MVASNSRVGQMFGKYEIVGLLGKGGMGEVYEANDTSKGRAVALKILAAQYSHDESFRTRFQRESRATAILQEPHVIPIHDWGEIDGNLYIDMRLVRGQTLQDLLEKGPLSPPRAVRIIDDVGAALDAAHAAGLIRRDVKPQNIIVTPTDFPYLVDFGIAEAKGDAGLTMTGTYVGTVSYMAPERFSGRSGTTSAVDVYSLACVLYECLTSQSPFSTNGLEQAMVAHLSTPPPAPSAINRKVSPAFDAVIARGMAKDAEARYPSAGALGRAAKQALGSVSTPVAAPPQQSPAATPTLRAPAAMPTEQNPINAMDTMAAPVAPRTVQNAAVSHDRSYGPPPSVDPPTIPVAQRPARSRPAQQRTSWLLPAVIGVVVAAALILGVIGIAITLQNRDSDASGRSSSLTAVNAPGASRQRSPSPDERPSIPASPTGPVSAPPPLVTGPDLSGTDELCDYGYVRNAETGFGTQAGRGSRETSCRFTASVLDAYWNQFGRPTPGVLRLVSAPGAVACGTVLTDRRGCDGNNFLVQCQEFPGQSYITCTGGRNAKVYVY